jgi:hypothetical protein
LPSGGVPLLANMTRFDAPGPGAEVSTRVRPLAPKSTLSICSTDGLWATSQLMGWAEPALCTPIVRNSSSTMPA